MLTVALDVVLARGPPGAPRLESRRVAGGGGWYCGRAAVGHSRGKQDIRVMSGSAYTGSDWAERADVRRLRGALCTLTPRGVVASANGPQISRQPRGRRGNAGAPANGEETNKRLKSSLSGF
ncbi:hypothetical protein AAFF_G00211580 [Aldrovandia affinis]|uniref:Uncharacterized protein n=1 Tax=Aldrovandia affinis TaxID=143900 RepID=A0AAD7SWJ4_9TELE|nr:hypothetical protein AAFF_G00211580 [Aldrovandia affinis]